MNEDKIIELEQVIPKLTTEKIVVNIDDVMPNSFNPNKMSDFIYEKMKATIKEKGLFGSIIVRRYFGRYQILDGEHRWKACKELGWEQIPVECSINEVSDSDTKFWTLYFNNTKGKDDIEKVAQIFETLEQGQSQLLPYTEDEIRNTKELFKFDFAQYQTNDPGLQNEIPHVLSFKFTEEEWKMIERVMEYVKKEEKTEKQWFMDMLDLYTQLRVSKL